MLSSILNVPSLLVGDKQWRRIVTLGIEPSSQPGKKLQVSVNKRVGISYFLHRGGKNGRCAAVSPCRARVWNDTMPIFRGKRYRGDFCGSPTFYSNGFCRSRANFSRMRSWALEYRRVISAVLWARAY